MPCFSLLSLSTAPQYTTLYQPDSFSTQHEKRFGTVWTATAQNWNKVFTRIEHSTMQSGWRRGSGALDPSSHLWISTSVSVGTSPSSYSFTSATVRIPVHTKTKQQKPIRYVTIHFQDWLGAASLCERNRAEITVLTYEQKLYPVWFYCLRKSELSVIVQT